MKHKFLLPIILLFLFSSCTKEEAEKIECESEDIGYLTITNLDEDPYYFYVDGVLQFTIMANTFVDDHELSAGTHSIKAEQKSGYLLWPTVYEESISIGQCEKISWVIPD